MPDWKTRPTTRLDAREPDHRLRPHEHAELLGSLPPRPRLAIVGSRAAHARNVRALDSVVGAAVDRGWSVVSGGALGIDAGAHRAALRLDCPQLAVLPCGRDRVYPPGHVELFTAIRERSDSGLIFAQPAGTEPRRAMFASRNRIVVALADAVVVAEASLRSGSIGTGRLASRAGLPVAAFVGTAGCGMLIAEGAFALPEPEVGVDDTRALVGNWLAGGDKSSGSRWPEPLAGLRDSLLAGPDCGVALEQLANPGQALVDLCEAELLGLVCEVTPGRWKVVVD